MLDLAHFSNVCVANDVQLDAQLIQLFSELVESEVVLPTLVLSRTERKWEVVSAWQKSIRRGDQASALRMCAAMLSAGGDVTYLWRRACVTVVEDIGLADMPLSVFILILSMAYTPGKHKEVQGKIMSFITVKLAGSVKDRTICDVANIVNCSESVGLDNYDEDEKDIYDAAVSITPNHEDSRIEFLRKQEWRTDGLGKYFGLFPWQHDGVLDETVEVVQSLKELPKFDVFAGIPSYAYDMYTRSGKISLVRFTGVQPVKALLLEFGVKDKMNAVGMAVFYVESSLLDRVLEYPLRQSIYRDAWEVLFLSVGVPRDRYEEFAGVVRENLPRLNEIRSAVVASIYM